MVKWIFLGFGVSNAMVFGASSCIVLIVVLFQLFEVMLTEKEKEKKKKAFRLINRFVLLSYSDMFNSI